jgi:hypothetical protein
MSNVFEVEDGKDTPFVDPLSSSNKRRTDEMDAVSSLHVFVEFLNLQVIAADGEHKAAWALKEAADVIGQSPSALQLRYLQTLTQIAAEKNSTILFPLPVEMLKGFSK